MGAFGRSDGMFAKALHFVFFAFGPSTAGTIYAFGYTLLTGVLLNFVFGVFATRVMIRGAASIKALRNPWLYGAEKPGKGKTEKKPIDFVGLRKRFLTISSCLMAAIVLCAVVLGVHLDTEFTGGAMITLSYEGSFTMSDVQKVASSALENNGLTLQTGENVATGDQTLKISMPGTETVTTEQVAKLLDSLNESCPDNNFEQLSLSNVSAAMGTKFLQKSLVAVVFALVLILLYIALRRPDRRHDGSAGACERPDGGVWHLCAAAHRAGRQLHCSHAYHPWLLHQRYRCGLRPYPREPHPDG